MAELSVVGKSVPRVDSVEKATGKAVFCGDIKLPRMLYAKVLKALTLMQKSSALILPRRNRSRAWCAC